MANAMFRTHLLNEAGIAKCSALGEAIGSISEGLEGEERCVAEARKHLEIANYFAKKALAVLPENQKVG